jgi:hypothetical protein
MARKRKGKIIFMGRNPFKEYILAFFSDNLGVVIKTPTNLKSGILQYKEEMPNFVKVKFSGHFFDGQVIYQGGKTFIF